MLNSSHFSFTSNHPVIPGALYESIYIHCVSPLKHPGFSFNLALCPCVAYSVNELFPLLIVEGEIGAGDR